MSKSNTWATVALVFCCLVTAIPTAKSHPLWAAVEGYKVGEKLSFNRIEFIDQGGFALSECLGEKYVLLLFWSRYFKHFDDTLKLARRLHSRYKDHDIEFLGVNLDSNWEKVEKSLIEFGLSFAHTYNPYLTFPSKLLGTFSQTEGSVVIINKEGEVVLLWQLVNSEDYNEIQHFLDQNLLSSY